MRDAAGASDPKSRIIEATWSAVIADPSRDPSVRAIASAARVNPAMVSYYFEGKDGLLAALFLPYAEALASERLKLLASAAEAKLSLEQVVAAWVAPDFEHPDNKRFATLWTMMKLHHAGLFGRLFSQVFDAGNRLFISTLSTLLPDVPPHLITWRLYALGGATLIAFDTFALESIDGMQTGPETMEFGAWRSELVAFAIAGFQALSARDPAAAPPARAPVGAPH